jgi:hypothetical protein
MALELLSQASAVRGANNARLLGEGVWVDGLGVVGIWLDSTNYNFAFYGAGQLDGEVVRITEPVSLIAKFSYDYAYDGLLARLYSSVNGRMYRTKPEDNIWTHEHNYPNLPTIYDRMIRLPDRWLRASGSTIYTAPLDGSTDWAVEHSFTPENTTYFTSSGVHISEAGGGLYWLGYHSGGLALYDADNQQVLESYKVSYDYSGVGNFTSIHWSRELKVFVATVWKYPGTPNQTEIMIFSDETRPSVLTNPVELSTLSRGHVSTMEVQLTGAHSDQVVGFPIDWSITSGTGTLSATQSLTDAEGKAQVDYIPDNLASSGFTLQAEAKF